MMFMRRLSMVAMLLERANRFAHDVDQPIDLLFLTDERRRERNRIPAIAHIETALPAIHGDLIRAASRFSWRGLDGQAGGQAVVADIHDVFEPFQTMHGILEVRR